MRLAAASRFPLVAFLAMLLVLLGGSSALRAARGRLMQKAPTVMHLSSPLVSLSGEDWMESAVLSNSSDVADAELRSLVASMLGVSGDEADKVSRWQVAFSGKVNVRRTKSLASRVLATKRHCSIIIGHREGGWVKLLGEPGYVKIRLRSPYIQLLKELPTKELAVAVRSHPTWAADCTDVASSLTSTSVTTAMPAETSTWQDATPSIAVPAPSTSLARGMQQPPRLAGSETSSLSPLPTDPRASSAAWPAATVAAITTMDPLTAGTSTATTTLPTTMTMTTTTQRPQPSLLCFVVARAGSYETGLVTAQRDRGASIFACDDHIVFLVGDPGTPTPVGADDSTLGAVLLSLPVVGVGNPADPGTTTNSWLNTRVFQVAWRAVVADTRRMRNDWVVKADPDTVFFPERLRDHMRIHTFEGGSGGGVFVVNCDRQFSDKEEFPQKLFGSLEVFSRDAIEQYANGFDRCIAELQWQNWGEDYFMQSCMVLLGGTPLYDPQLIGDGRCWPASCTDTSRVAYHDFKDVTGYFSCWEASLTASGVNSYPQEAPA